MSRNISIGIDIGSYQIKAVAAETVTEDKKELPKVVGVGYAESKGLRPGYILSEGDAVKSVRSAVTQAEKAAGFSIKRAIASVGGIGLGSVTSVGSIITSRADLEITALDIQKAVEASQQDIPAAQSANRKIIHTIPIQYKVDGKLVLGKPEGLKGSKLEVKTLFITCFEHHLNDLLEVIQEAGVEVEDIVASPIAASLVTLSKSQKMAGCVLANIGSETVSIVVFENNLPISLEI